MNLSDFLYGDEKLPKYDSVIIVNVDKATKDRVLEKAHDNGSTMSQIIRDFVSDVANGKIKPITRIRIDHPLEPGEYAFVPM